MDMDTQVMEDMDTVIEDMAITMGLDMDTIVMEVMGIEDMDMVMDTEHKLKLKLLEFRIIEVSIMLSQSHMLKYINHALNHALVLMALPHNDNPIKVYK